MKAYLVRGVPMQMQQDGWWMNAEPPQRSSTSRDRPRNPKPTGAALLVLLIVLADVLVWQVAPGLSLAVFATALLTAAICRLANWHEPRRLFCVATGGLLAFLPLVELVQPLSVIVAVVGLSMLLAFLAGARLRQLGHAALRLWPLGTYQVLVDARQVVRGRNQVALSGMLRQFVLHWLIPAVFGTLFVVLLLAANPVADRWATMLAQVEIASPGWPRGLFWLAVVPVAWTALSLGAMRERLRAESPAARFGPKQQGIVNQASTTRALFLFNAVFALQTLMDVVYLYGGVGLPDGITYAEYAHRGAYPLLVTALLAGGFALLTRRWTEGSDLLRALMLIWIAQNVALVISSLVRLDLYVDVYGLTHLRVAAGIWMGLVACGLILILWQLWQGRDNRWLLVRTGALGFCTLYLCTFISFDAVIARHNLIRADRWDYPYICRLGDAAQPVIAAHELSLGRAVCQVRYQVVAPHDWREWGFRNWRARNSLSALQAESAP